MTSTSTTERRMATVSRSKSVPWFQSKIGSSLTPASRQLLETYSGIDPSDIENHLYKIRDQAWEIFPWPCVGGFWFIQLGLSLHPSYASVLSRLRSSSSNTQFLDLGTCLGQDLRKLLFDGAPLQSLYGLDIFPEYERMGHELFRDADTFQNRFIAADILGETVDSKLAKTDGTWDVISINMFLHIFDWDTQVRTCRRILKLLSKKPGSMVIGVQTGSIEAGEHVLKPPYVEEGERKTVYRQSMETFTEMWKIVERDEGVELKVNVVYDEKTDRDRRAKEEETGEKKRFFSGPEERRLYFTVEVLQHGGVGGSQQ